MPTETEYFKWWITDERTGERRRTAHKMNSKQAAERYPGSEPDPATRELRAAFVPTERLQRQR